MARIWCWLFGHKWIIFPYLPGSSQNWYDVGCPRCTKIRTISGGDSF